LRQHGSGDKERINIDTYIKLFYTFNLGKKGSNTSHDSVFYFSHLIFLGLPYFIILLLTTYIIFPSIYVPKCSQPCISHGSGLIQDI
jgi:hypothetical protein